MTVEYWYMFPAAVAIATIAMASGGGWGHLLFTALYFVLAEILL